MRDEPRDFIQDLRAGMVKLRKFADAVDPAINASLISWIAMMEGIIDDHSPKTTQRIQQGQVAPATDDMAAGAGR